MYDRHQPEVTPEHKEFLKRVKLKKVSVLTTQILILVLFFVVWELAARYKIIDAFITSQPSRVLKTLVNLYARGELLRHVGITCLETVIGFTSATVLGTATAIALWWSDFLAKVMEPYLVVLSSLPKIALGPIFIVWIGAGPAAIIVMTLAISIIVAILEVLNGFLSVDQEKIKLVKTFGARKLQVFTKVVLPASFPTIINALKVNVGLSWVGVIMGEFLVSKAGLGYLIVYGGQVFQLDLVMTSVLILAIAAAAMYQGVVYLEKIVVKNRYEIKE
ncbi:MAG: ABC transporter permease [Clostridiales bacterium]|jgi:NitT/TauT family transport system permease protein|nr:ABC transporter permease [Eubacteriales bacterium]MDH7567039.1 ABC transporter permease [Clostridiales bacterium]